MPVELSELLPDLPEEDRAGLEKWWGAGAEHRWGIGERPAIVVVDMTRAFVEDRFPSGWAKTGEPCAESIRRLLDVARPAGIPIFYTVTEPLAGAEVGAWLRGRPTPSTFPFDGPPEAHEIVDILTPEPGEIVIKKPKPSAFYATQLEGMLNYVGADSLIVTGMTTSGCVRATVNDAFNLNYRVTVPLECVADRSQLSHRVELLDMTAKYADLSKLDEVIEVIGSRA
ncbi:isochorismatase family protein [Microbacterium sp. X-17]|uniref:isochorismatase family protein n=1 Tax=Microbacterium sp. X-17 TaxID=3144404 RepID=UPI0031F5436D